MIKITILYIIAYKNQIFIQYIMAIVKPFKGVRPPKEFVEQVESRPYDVLNSEEAAPGSRGPSWSSTRSYRQFRTKHRR